MYVVIALIVCYIIKKIKEEKKKKKRKKEPHTSYVTVAMDCTACLDLYSP